MGRLGWVIHKSWSHGLGNGLHGLGNGPRGLGNGRILNIVKVDIFGCWARSKATRGFTGCSERSRSPGQNI